MDRRDFTRICGGLLAAAEIGAIAGRADAAPGAAPPTPRSRLVHADGAWLRPAELADGEALVFGYPYVATPCFLIRLSATALPDATSAGERIVAFSAICSHKMTHPSRPISHIAFRPDTVAFTPRGGTRTKRANVISCCSERSVYDPAAGGAVLAGPAPAALPRIGLEIDEEGIVAVSSTGEDRYAAFLEQFAFRLVLELGIPDVREYAGDTAIAESASSYSRQIVRC